MTSTTSQIIYADADEEQRDMIRLNTRRQLLQNMPDEPHLQLWLLHVLDMWLPHRQVCDGHDAPLAYFTDRYYDKIFDTILWGARICGKSMMAGLECWMKGRDLRHPYWRANVCAGSGAQARNVYDATDLFWTRTDDIGGRAVLAKEPLKTYTEYLDGSKYEITTSSETAQRGLHPNQLFADELDQIPYATFRAALNQTREGYGHKPSTAILSTMHKIGGLMADWVDNAEDRGYKLYTICILETLEACTGDYNCETCNLDQYCERRLKDIFREEEKSQQESGIIVAGEKPFVGFNTIETIQQKVRQGYETEEATGNIKSLDVEAELFCKRPSRTGLVFPEFNKAFHVVPAQEINIPTAWPKARTTDFGYTAPYVELRYAITPRDQIIFYYEFVKSGMTLDEVADSLALGRKHTKFLNTFGDPAGATEIATLRARGILIKEVVSEIVEGLNFMHTLLRQRIDGNKPAFIISSDCRILISEMTKLSYPEKGDVEKPVKKDDHCVEAARRGIVAWMRGALQPLNEILKEVITGDQGHGLETAPDTAYRETKQAVQRVKAGRRGRLDEGREPIRRTQDYL